MKTVDESALPGARAAIREFEPKDYPSVVAILNRLFPDHPTSVEEERFEDERFKKDGVFRRRFVAVADSDGVVGSLSYGHMPWAHHADRYSIWIGVQPEWQKKGIGRSLYARLEEDLRVRRAAAVRTWVREAMEDAVAWLSRRSFLQLHRSWQSRLDVAAFDASRFRKEAEVPEGIHVVTLADELAKDPTRLRAVYELDNVVSADVPRVDPYTSPSFDLFRTYVVNGPNALPEACFLAKDGDAYVGVSNLERLPSLPDTLHTGFTGVRREYRGRGIAMHLKLRAIEYAKGHGTRWIRTGNSTLNAPMLGINMKLGFVKEVVWVTMGKDLGGA